MSMLAMTWGQWFLGLVLFGLCCLLILVILLQKGRGGGLTGAFGGAGGSSAFGAKTGDVFTWITVVVASLFLVLSIVANFVFDQSAELRPRAVQAAPVDVVPSTGPEGQAIPISVTTDGGEAMPITVTPVAPPTDPAAPPAEPPPSSGETPPAQPEPETDSAEPGAEPQDEADRLAEEPTTP